jgi:2-phosphosulfolactate phosphatase
VVVIDVLRAFSTAAYAFAAGVEEIHLVSTVEEAFSLKEEINHAMIMGEVDGLVVEGFDFGNSPPQFDGLNLAGVPFIQRTTSGTQGVVRSQFTDVLLTASFCNARATAEYIEHLSQSEVSFVISGLRQGGWGDEDLACADYIKAQLSQNEVDPESYLQRVRESTPGRLFQDPELPAYPLKDLEYCLTINKFDFAMPVQRSGEHLLMRASKL